MDQLDYFFMKMVSYILQKYSPDSKIIYFDWFEKFVKFIMNQINIAYKTMLETGNSRKKPLTYATVCSSEAPFPVSGLSLRTRGALKAESLCTVSSFGTECTIGCQRIPKSTMVTF